jgi:hypothetical protein
MHEKNLEAIQFFFICNREFPQHDYVVNVMSPSKLTKFSRLVVGNSNTSGE